MLFPASFPSRSTLLSDSPPTDEKQGLSIHGLATNLALRRCHRSRGDAEGESSAQESALYGGTQPRRNAGRRLGSLVAQHAERAAC